MGFAPLGGPMEEFAVCFAELDDPREDNARHDLHEILMIAFCTMLCGGEDCSDMALFGRAKEPFLRQFLQLRHGIPSHDTFSRVFRLLDPAQFQACFLHFMEGLRRGRPGRDRDRRQDAAPLLRPGRREIAAAPGERLGGRFAAGPRASRDR